MSYFRVLKNLELLKNKEYYILPWFDVPEELIIRNPLVTRKSFQVLDDGNIDDIQVVLIEKLDSKPEEGFYDEYKSMYEDIVFCV